MFGRTEVPTYFYAIYILVILAIIRAIQIAFFKPLKTPSDYMQRADYWVSYLRAYNKGIKVLEEALKLPDLTLEERDNIYLKIGNINYFKRDYKRASEEYDKIKELFYKKHLEFDKSFLHAIISYYNSGNVQKARSLYHTLKKHEKNDPKYGYLESLNKRIFK